MKNMPILILGLIAGLAMAGSSTSLAQTQPDSGPKGRGYGGPPQSADERTARQADCLQENGGVCPNGGPKQFRQGGGRGHGKRGGYGWGHGLRDGTGPRSIDGTCPLTSPKAQK